MRVEKGVPHPRLLKDKTLRLANFRTLTSPHMFSIFTHVMKPVRDTHSEPGLPMVKSAHQKGAILEERGENGNHALWLPLALPAGSAKFY